MKKLLIVMVLIVGALYTNEVAAQKVRTVKLEQTPGKFTQQSLDLKSDTPYVFEITNRGIDHGVGFVLAPKGQTQRENHIVNAYVQDLVMNGKSQQSHEVILAPGEYVYFCPLNPTEEYSLVVE